MRCSCPKCSANVNIDRPEIPAEGIYLNCPECNVSIQLRRDSFAKRALHKSPDIFCAECGNAPGTSTFCQHCHAIYPDYLVADTSSATKKQFANILTSLRSIGRKSAKSSHTGQDNTYRPKQASGKEAGLPRQVKMIAILVGLVAATGLGWNFYNQYKLETNYRDNFVRTIFGIKKAEDMNLKICANLASDWKSKQMADAPRPSANELKSISRAKTDVDTLLSQLGTAPKSFTTSHADLVKVYNSYSKLQALTQSPTGSPESFMDATKKLDEEFRKAANVLKSGLPEKLSEGLNSAKSKFKQLQDF